MPKHLFLHDKYFSLDMQRASVTGQKWYGTALPSRRLQQFDELQMTSYGPFVR